MPVTIHVQVMSSEGTHDRISGPAKAVVHDGVAIFKGLAAATVAHFLAPFRGQVASG